MNKFNLDKLVKVKVNDFYPSNWYKFIKGKQKKYFWQTSTKEGIYFDGFTLEYCKDQNIKNHTLIDNVLHENPEVKLYFQGGQETIKYFLTLDEAQAFADELTKGKNWLLN